MSDLKWSTNDNAKQLPLPKSSIAYVRNENNYRYELFVGETTFETSLKKGEHTLVIENEDDDDINGRIDFIVSDAGGYYEFEIECLGNKVVINSMTDKLSEATDFTSEEKEETDSKTEKEEVVSVTEQAYCDSANLTVNDLTKKEDSLGVSYSYQGLELLSEDCEWIENSRNTNKTVESGAIYRKIAMGLEGFKIGNNWKRYAEWLIGFTPESRDEFAPYVENSIAFITMHQPLESCMKEFEKLDCVSGTFDFDKGIYNFEISSLSSCASEMQISKEMLGYIFAMLDEYGATTIFEGDTCIFSYKDYRN